MHKELTEKRSDICLKPLETEQTSNYSNINPKL